MRDQKQQAAICNVLTRRVRHKGISWSADGGPSPQALVELDVLEAQANLEHVSALIKVTGQRGIVSMLEEVRGCGFEGRDRETLLLWCPEESTARAQCETTYRAYLLGFLNQVDLRGFRFVTDHPGSGMSSGERLVMLAGWAFWSSAGYLKLSDVYHRMPSAELRLIGSLLMALSTGDSADLDRWIEAQGPEVRADA